MKVHAGPAIKAHLIRGAFYLLLFAAVCVVPFAFAQRAVIKRIVSRPEISNASSPSGACNPIVNGGFETGDFTGWIIDGVNATPVITNANSHSGLFSAFAGNAPDGFSRSERG